MFTEKEKHHCRNNEHFSLRLESKIIEIKAIKECYKMVEID